MSAHHLKRSASGKWGCQCTDDADFSDSRLRGTLVAPDLGGALQPYRSQNSFSSLEQLDAPIVSYRANFSKFSVTLTIPTHTWIRDDRSDAKAPR